jgi:hypothetical protein
MQVMMLSQSPGSKLYVETYTSGLAYKSIGSITVDPHVIDGNHVVASRHPHPWRKQFNLLAAYAYFYNPLRFLMALILPNTRIPLADLETRPVAPGQTASKRKSMLRRRIQRKLRVHLSDAAMQLFGMWGLTHTIRHTFVWMMRLATGKITRHTQPPMSRIPMRSPDGSPASHALPGTPTSQLPTPGSKDQAGVAAEHVPKNWTRV